MFKGPLIEIIQLIFKSNRTDWDIINVVLSLFSVLIILFVIFPLRNCGRGLVAKLLGDDTPERSGMLTLNPIVHLDLIGALAMLICRIGWTKPMPIDIRRCTKVSQKKAVVLISLAGPVTNILLAYVLTIIYKIVMLSASTDNLTAVYIGLGLLYTIQISVFLAVLNLVPIPPLDGFNVLAYFLPGKAVYFMQKNQQIFYWVFFALLIFGVLDVPLGAATNGIIWLLEKASFFIPTAI